MWTLGWFSDQTYINSNSKRKGRALQEVSIVPTFHRSKNLYNERTYTFELLSQNIHMKSLKTGILFLIIIFIRVAMFY